jgi:hypothetical protein
VKTVTSISGGKSSCYMALNFPTEHYVFAVVLTDHTPSAPKDKALLRECQNRIPSFVASHEADQTLLNVLRLEQELGTEIKWVSAEFSLDQFVLSQTDLPSYRSGKPMLPNATTRFCTIEQKIKPIFWHCYMNWWNGDPFLMNLGFRWDERRRVENWNCKNDRMRFPVSAPVYGGKWRKKEIEWRVPRFPLYEERITHDDVRRFWAKKGWEFPEISNCRMCFHHTDIQLQRQAQADPDNAQWWVDAEARVGNTFGKRALKDILAQPILDVFHDEPCLCHD